MKQIPIIVVTYNRPRSLRRLLDSLVASHFRETVQLIISIDGGGDGSCAEIAAALQWPHGGKEVIRHPVNLGLRKHILACGSLTGQYDGAIILEDDLFVSPFFYDYVMAAADFYDDDDRIAGISLYSHAYNETAQFPFIPNHDGSDVFFMQLASSWGQYWSKKQWEQYTQWTSTTDEIEVPLPGNVQLWPDSSWKKNFIRYMVSADRYFVYPRTSLTTNFNEAGQHQVRREYFLQRPLVQAPCNFRFIGLDHSLAVYDCYNELSPNLLKKLNPTLHAFDFETDLYGMKDPGRTNASFLLTSAGGNGQTVSFGRELKPMEANIVMNIPGDHFRMLPAGKVRRRSHFRKLMRCSTKKELKYHYGMRFYHHRWAWLIMMAGNFLYHPRVFPKLKKLSGWILRSPSR